MTTDIDPPRRLMRAEQVLANRTRRVAIVLEASQDPHNVHAVLRTAEALGVQDVHLVAPRGAAASISPGVTQRAHEWLTLRRHADIDAAARVLREEGRTVLGADNAVGARSLTGLRTDTPLALVLGNETEGLSARARELVDGLVRIDIVGFSGSLNMSVSAAIIMWELRREEVARELAGDLDVASRAALRATWYPSLFGRAPDDPVAAAWLVRGEEVRARALELPRTPPDDRSQRAPGCEP